MEQAVDHLGVILCGVQVDNHLVLMGTHLRRGKAHECDRNLLLHLLSPGNDLVVEEEVAVRVLAEAVEPVGLELVRWEQQFGVRRVVVMMGLLRMRRRIRTTTVGC